MAKSYRKCFRTITGNSEDFARKLHIESNKAWPHFECHIDYQVCVVDGEIIHSALLTFMPSDEFKEKMENDNDGVD